MPFVPPHPLPMWWVACTALNLAIRCSAWGVPTFTNVAEATSKNNPATVIASTITGVTPIESRTFARRSDTPILVKHGASGVQSRNHSSRVPTSTAPRRVTTVQI